jgi:hypothetical protein
LLEAILQQNYNTAMALLDMRASATAETVCELQSLHLVAEWTQRPDLAVALARTLLSPQHGADIEAIDQHNETPLMYSVTYDNAVVAQFLLNATANVDVKDEYDRTALQQAQDNKKPFAAAAILSWLKDRDAARAFTRGTMHARRSHKKHDWTDSKLFDKHLIGLITAFVTPRPLPYTKKKAKPIIYR